MAWGRHTLRLSGSKSPPYTTHILKAQLLSTTTTSLLTPHHSSCPRHHRTHLPYQITIRPWLRRRTPQPQRQSIAGRLAPRPAPAPAWAAHASRLPHRRRAATQPTSPLPPLPLPHPSALPQNQRPHLHLRPHQPQPQPHHPLAHLPLHQSMPLRRRHPLAPALARRRPRLREGAGGL